MSTLLGMKKPINAKEILQKLQSPGGKRTKCSLYLSESIYGEFKDNCGTGLASRVMEELMQQFNDSIKASKVNKSKK